jgi:hypothetical protein
MTRSKPQHTPTPPKHMIFHPPLTPPHPPSAEARSKPSTRAARSKPHPTHAAYAWHSSFSRKQAVSQHFFIFAIPTISYPTNTHVPPPPPYSTQCDPRTRTNPRCHPLTGEAPPFLARRQPHRVCSNLLLLLLPPTATINIIITITVTNITITITSTTSAQGTPIVFQQ